MTDYEYTVYDNKTSVYTTNNITDAEAYVNQRYTDKTNITIETTGDRWKSVSHIRTYD